MSTIVQTQPSSSAQNPLCFARPPSDVLSLRGTISALPNELLAYIFWNLEDYRLPYERQPPLQWLVLARVCRRWRDIIDTFLYRNLILRGRDESRHSLLLKAFRDRQHLREYPRTLNLTLEGNVVSRDIAQIMALLTSVREISFQADFDEPHRPLLQIITSMAPEKLFLRGLAFGPSVNMLFDVFQYMPSLHELHLTRWGWSREKRLHTGYTQNDNVLVGSDDLRQALSMERRRTAAFTVLNLQEPNTSARVTECLLHWPARLEELSMKFLCHSHYAVDYQTHSLQTLLSIHQQTLKKITIGVIPQHQGGIPDFSGFPCLEELCVSAYSILHDPEETPWTAYRKLSTPSLRRLEIDFSTEDQHCESWTDYFEDQLDWTEDFLEIVAPGLHTSPPETRLRNVHINFNPKMPWRPMELIWPWHWLIEATKVATPLGISLTYSTPSWTMEDYEQTQERMRRFNMMMGS
ncbi:F-box protein [Aspergillus melleus]|uniref:F-box protein n=1 Tax=Aspergillus melleus TaxID=138277 RepID=UPI001E8D79AB|nr:uncharacterized protein LDX57_000435 [Aspergillus melleus]KAH8422681.1 hypothetical protein LDX57_000435 [Aspergillus melleus]